MHFLIQRRQTLKRNQKHSKNAFCSKRRRRLVISSGRWAAPAEVLFTLPSLAVTRLCLEMPGHHMRAQWGDTCSDAFIKHPVFFFRTLASKYNVRRLCLALWKCSASLVVKSDSCFALSCPELRLSSKNCEVCTAQCRWDNVVIPADCLQG